MNSPTLQSDDRGFMELLNRLIPVEAIVETLAALLNATTILKNRVVVPDWSSRFEAAKLILAYKIGLPIPRKDIVVVQQNGDKEHDLIERMANTPSLLESIKWMVTQAEARKLATTAQLTQGRTFPPSVGPRFPDMTANLTTATSSPLLRLLQVFDAESLGEGDMAAAANVLAANSYPPGACLVSDDGSRLTVGMSFASIEGLTNSLIADKVIAPLACLQNHLVDHVIGQSLIATRSASRGCGAKR